MFVYAGRGIRGGPGPGAQWALYPEGSHTRAAIDDGFGWGYGRWLWRRAPTHRCFGRWLTSDSGGRCSLRLSLSKAPNRSAVGVTPSPARKLLAVHHPGGPDARSARLLEMIRKVD